MDYFLLIALLISGISSPVNGQLIGGALYQCMACTGVLQQEFACTVNCDRTDSNGGASNTQLTQLIEQMNATINSQQTMIALLQNQISGMNETISNLQTTTSNQQTAIDNHNTTINNYGTSISTHETEINALQAKDVSVAFYYTEPQNPSSTTPEVLKFTNLKLDTGNRYNTNTGIFTADTAGLYHFQVHLLFDEAKWGTVYIRKNDVVHCTQWGQGGSVADSDEIHTSCSALMELEVGDRVDAYLDPDRASPLEAAFYHEFLGFLIRAD